MEVFFSSPPRQGRLWGPSSVYTVGTGGKEARSQAHHLHLVQSLRMRGAVPPPPYVMARCLCLRICASSPLLWHLPLILLGRVINKVSVVGHVSVETHMISELHFFHLRWTDPSVVCDVTASSSTSPALLVPPRSTLTTFSVLMCR
jgi:hypothetical protein